MNDNKNKNLKKKFLLIFERNEYLSKIKKSNAKIKFDINNPIAFELKLNTAKPIDGKKNKIDITKRDIFFSLKKEFLNILKYYYFILFDISKNFS